MNSDLGSPCWQIGNSRGAIEFLLLAGRSADAFNEAINSGNMDIYTDVIASGPSPLVAWMRARLCTLAHDVGILAAMGGHVPEEELLKIARYFEEKGKPGLAGKFYAKASHFHRALRNLLDVRWLLVIPDDRSVSLISLIVDGSLPMETSCSTRLSRLLVAPRWIC